ncbi:MAG: DNA methyltransferase, partial [Campylobacterota bacterium]|nr:DNA methyltransferase [Campylobacterota bacterium]
FKEEEYQDGFLHDIFEACLGYTLKTTNPDDYTLSREAKNETDSKKADGALWSNGKVVGVIELKGQDSKNLDKATDQAFNYLVSNSDARYVIVSNFNELRFYIDKKTQYQKFNLFTLSYDEFKMLHLLLSYESIAQNIPLKLKEQSNSFEAQISKELYRDFSSFRMHLFDNLIANNTTVDKSLLLRLTQKLCDRIIFILFAEDRGLLRANSIKEIREDFKEQKFTNHSLYNIYKFYFDAINEGNERLGIPKYNGGLFAKDEILDSLIIDDHILDHEVQKLSDYDFESEVSVNILGHIFEQSLTDLEEIQASIDNDTLDKSQTKRKKDGVFYTPEYITRYIVDNTLGKMCNDKREELNLLEIKPPKNPKKPTKKEQQLQANIEAYREWLLNIKILDPACGSGAFLNQALDYLISEHKAIQDDLITMGDITAYYEIEKSILENNLYGVDINEDATEIAKLSLWLKTAQKGRELTKLADKILVANSLLEMPFEMGSFDIVIGNPPYVRVQGLKSNYEDEAKLYEERYLSATGNYDIYVLFMEMSYKMLK